MKRKVLMAASLIVLITGGFLFMENAGIKEPAQAEPEDIKQLVEDYSTGKLKAKSASITGQELVVTENDESQVTYDLSEEEFFVSIAPYKEQTHPCAVHNLAGCRGEMVEEEFNVYIEDAEGNVVLNESMKSHANGFIDLWLPRNGNYSLVIEHAGTVAESEFSTFENDNTCNTTMQLKENRSA